MKQQISREESRRLHSEFEKFYAVHPEYRVQANHGQWIEIANENGGTETLSKEQMELWLSDPSLRNRLAKLKTIPADDLNSFLQDHPWLESVANRNMIWSYMLQNYQSAEQAADTLGDRLSIDHQVQEDQQAKQEQAERSALIEEICADYSKDEHARSRYWEKLQSYSTDALRNTVSAIHERRELARMNPSELRSYLKQARSVAPAPRVIPESITPAQIKSMSALDLRKMIDQYGASAVNDRLGVTIPFAGNVRNVNMELVNE